MAVYKVHPTTLWFRTMIESPTTMGNIIVDTTLVSPDIITSLKMIGVSYEREIYRSEYTDQAWHRHSSTARIICEALDTGARTAMEIYNYIIKEK